MDLNTLIIFIFGLVFGSFFNVVGYRLPNNLSIIKPGSFCPVCKNNLKWYENIPVISFIIQRGKCRNCSTKISFYYIVIELLTASLFAISYKVFGFSEEFFISIITSSFLVIVIISDCKYLMIPDSVTVSAVVALFIVKAIYHPDLIYLFKSLASAAVVFGVMYLIMYLGNKAFKKESLGGGDIKLMFFVGLAVGIKLGLFTIFLASFLAFPISLVFYLREEDSIIPFGPFLLIALLAIVLLKIDLVLFLANLIK